MPSHRIMPKRKKKRDLCVNPRSHASRGNAYQDASRPIPAKTWPISEPTPPSNQSRITKKWKTGFRSARLAFLLSVAVVAWLSLTLDASAQAEPPFITLEEAIQMAQNHSYQRKAAQYRVESARQDRHGAWAEMMPSLQGEYSYARLKEQPYMRAGNTELMVGPNDNFHWDVSVIQPLFTGFALTSQLESRELTVAVREQEARSASLDVRRDAQLAYFDLLLARKLREVASQTVTALEAQEQDAKRFFEQELIPLNDLLRSQVALSDATQSMEKAEASVRLAKTRLNLLLGLPAAEALTTADIDDIPPYQADLDALTAKALEARPDIQAARLGLDTLKKAVTAAKSSYYPHVGAFATYEQDGDNFAADSNDYSNEQNASAGIKLEWEIFDWGKTRSEVAKNKAELRAAEQRLKLLEDGVRLQVQSAFLDLQVARKNTGTAQKTLAQARENRRIVKLRYDQQIATSTDVLNAQADLTRADTNYYRALYGYMMSLANLERAVGDCER